MKRHAAVWRGPRATWWACTVPADLYEPDRAMPQRAAVCVWHKHEDFPTHEAALAHALAEVGLDRRDPSETIPDSPDTTAAGTETEGDCR